LEKLSTLDLYSGLAEFLSKGQVYFCEFMLDFAKQRIKEMDEMLAVYSFKRKKSCYRRFSKE